jgi:hypothetical protein
MAYTTAHAVLSWGGPLFDGGEEWTNSLRLIGAGAESIGTQEHDTELMTEYADVIKARVAAAGCPSTQLAKVTWVKFNRVGLDGRYRNEYTNRLDFAAVSCSANASFAGPAQVSQVITLRSASKRGLAHAGRIYLPVPDTSLGTDGRISLVKQAADLAWVKSTLDAINAVDISLYIGIASKVRTGASKRVVRVEVGRVLDTMRSRRSSLAEDYVGSDLAG